DDDWPRLGHRVAVLHPCGAEFRSVLAAGHSRRRFIAALGALPGRPGSVEPDARVGGHPDANVSRLLKGVDVPQPARANLSAAGVERTAEMGVLEVTIKICTLKAVYRPSYGSHGVAREWCTEG